MSNTSFKKFKKFYKENIKNIFMKKRENHRLNYEKANHWANSQCDPESKEFAHWIIKNTEYVSFGKFIDRLQRVCESYLKTYSTPEHKNTHFVLIIPFKINKSNTWVSLLAYRYLQKIITDVRYDVTEVYNSTIDHKSNLYRKKVRCIICDDCAYTGHQIEFISSLNTNWIKYPNRSPPPTVYEKSWIEWNNTVSRESHKYITNISIDDFSVDLIIPYMSIGAQLRLKKIHYIKIPSDCWIFPLFTQQVDMDRIPIHIVNEFKKTFQYHKNISAIYFDHKIADAVSTFHKIYLLAPLFNCVVTNKRIGFIENCTEENKIHGDINIYNYYINLEPILKDKTCPPSYYKGIQYKFNNKLVDKDLYLFELFSK